MPEGDAKNGNGNGNGNGYKIPPWAQQLLYFAGFIGALIFSFSTLKSDQRSTSERLAAAIGDLEKLSAKYEKHVEESPRKDVMDLRMAGLEKELTAAVALCKEAPRSDVLESRLRGIEDRIVAATDEITLQRMNNKAFREQLLAKGVLRAP